MLEFLNEVEVVKHINRLKVTFKVDMVGVTDNKITLYKDGKVFLLPQKELVMDNEGNLSVLMYPEDFPSPLDEILRKLVLEKGLKVKLKTDEKSVSVIIPAEAFERIGFI